MAEKRYLILEHSSSRFVCQGLQRLGSDIGIEIEEPSPNVRQQERALNVLVFDKKTEGAFVVPNVEPDQFDGIAMYYRTNFKKRDRHQFYTDVLGYVGISLVIREMILIAEAMGKYSYTDKSNDVARYHYSYHHDSLYFDDGDRKHLIYNKGIWAYYE